MNGFCFGGELHLISSTHFQFFDDIQDEKWFLCLDERKCQKKCDAKFPMDITLQEAFIQLCQFENNNKKWEVGQNWKSALDWLGASETILDHFQTNLLPDEHAWKQFQVHWPNPSPQQLQSDFLLAIKHDLGETYLEPELDVDFAIRNNIPNQVTEYVYQSEAIIAGSACLPVGKQKSDIDIWVYFGPHQQETISKLRDMLKSYGYSILKHKSVLSCSSPTYQTIQIIASNTNYAETIIRSFDFDCIRCYYDGIYMHHTILSKYCQDNNILNVPHPALILKPHRVIRYMLKGFKLQKQEIEALRFSVGWPLSKEKQQAILQERLSKLILKIEIDDEKDMVPWGASVYPEDVVLNNVPFLFRGSISAFVNTLYFIERKMD